MVFQSQRPSSPESVYPRTASPAFNSSGNNKKAWAPQGDTTTLAQYLGIPDSGATHSSDSYLLEQASKNFQQRQAEQRLQLQQPDRQLQHQEAVELTQGLPQSVSQGRETVIKAKDL